MPAQITFVLGGAASGKSAWAEGLVSATGLPRIYIATAQAFDREMERKVAAHRARRGADWQVIEAPQDLPAALGRVPAGRVVLVDCATIWLSNRLLAGADLAAEGEALLAALSNCASPVAIVSNEVGQGIVPDSALARQFREAQGRLNCRIAERAERVVVVQVGLARALKGNLPEAGSC